MLIKIHVVRDLLNKPYKTRDAINIQRTEINNASGKSTIKLLCRKCRIATTVNKTNESSPLFRLFIKGFKSAKTKEKELGN